MHRSLLALALVFIAINSRADDKPVVDTKYPDVIRSAASGAWSDASTWEGKKVPAGGARVHILPGHVVTYDVESKEVIRSINIAGTLTFSRKKDTRLDVALIKIQASREFSEEGFDCDAHDSNDDSSA